VLSTEVKDQRDSVEQILGPMSRGAIKESTSEGQDCEDELMQELEVLTTLEKKS
jgi:hypothetical protein